MSAPRSPDIYTHCPKCGHTPLPADQSLPAACPACGIILAKFGLAPPPRAVVSEAEAEESSIASRSAALMALLTHVPERVDPTMFWARVAMVLVFSVWGMMHILLDIRTGEMMNAFLHRPLLVFHEAGHVLFIPFGRFLTVAGGTLGQLIMPLVLAFALLRQNRDPLGASIGVWLLGVSLLDVAPYAYDALHPQLMLLGGQTGEEGGHDWIYLLGTFGLVPKAHAVGWLIHKAGALVVIGSMLWAAWLLKEQQKRLSDGAVIEG